MVSAELPAITKGAKRAVVVLTAMSLLLAATSILFTIQYVRSTQAAQQRQAAQQAASQRAQGAAFEKRLCTSLGRLAALTPPPGSPAGNPSRAYLQAQHDVLAELGPDVGCGP